MHSKLAGAAQGHALDIAMMRVSGEAIEEQELIQNYRAELSLMEKMADMGIDVNESDLKWSDTKRFTVVELIKMQEKEKQLLTQTFDSK